jgi:hypothetical protein
VVLQYYPDHKRNTDSRKINVSNISEIEEAIALMMEAVSTSETSVYIYGKTGRNIPEGCHLLKN